MREPTQRTHGMFTVWGAQSSQPWRVKTGKGENWEDLNAMNTLGHRMLVLPHNISLLIFTSFLSPPLIMVLPRGTKCDAFVSFHTSLSSFYTEKKEIGPWAPMGPLGQSLIS